jgi:hypothetical protein
MRKKKKKKTRAKQHEGGDETGTGVSVKMNR